MARPRGAHRGRRVRQAGRWWIPDREAHLEGHLAAAGGEYQQPHRARSLRHCARRRVALDIGAHIGLWSRDLARAFEQVHAFEPVAAFRECFARNVDAPNVVMHPCALGNTEGRVRLAIDEAHSGMTHVAEIGDEGDEGIEVRRLDSFGLEGVDYVKIDVEGFELFVLEGARETLLRCRPVVTLEQKAHGAAYFGLAQYAALEFLKGLGAQVVQRVIDDWVLAWPEPGAQ